MSRVSGVCDVDARAAGILAASEGIARYLVAVAGPPASGKSTLAAQLAAAINVQAGAMVSAIVPMDGFHLDNSVLEALGLLSRKGAPETFDAQGFVTMVRTLAGATDDVVWIPAFDRKADAVVADAMQVTPEQRILVLEGNYLLSERAPWCSVHNLYHETIFLNPDISVLKERLIARWRYYGLSEQAAYEKVVFNDLPNAEWVLRYSVMKVDK